jgi:predicted lipoprotein with Yx(FWY)xxD motif
MSGATTKQPRPSSGGRTGRRCLTAVSVLAGLLTAACGAGAGGDTATGRNTEPQAPAYSETTSAPAPVQRPTPSGPAAGLPVTTADSDYGPMLFDQRGQAIYLFDKETSGRPDCYGDCAVAWPPVLTTGPPQAAGAVRGDLLGTVARDDGSTQVTYAGHPLYYYAHEAPGQVLCHDVVEFGGRWLVVTPEGTAAA